MRIFLLAKRINYMTRLGWQEDTVSYHPAKLAGRHTTYECKRAAELAGVESRLAARLSRPL